MKVKYVDEEFGKKGIIMDDGVSDTEITLVDTETGRRSFLIFPLTTGSCEDTVLPGAHYSQEDNG